MSALRNSLAGIAVASLLVGGAAANGQAPERPASPTAGSAMQHSNQSVFSILSNDPRFVTTMQMVYVIGEARRLHDANNLVVFAATNSAWSAGSDAGLMSSLWSPSKFSTTQADSSGIHEALRGFIVRGVPRTLTTSDVWMQSVMNHPIDLKLSANTVEWTNASGEHHSAHISGVPIKATNGLIVPVDGMVGS